MSGSSFASVGASGGDIFSQKKRALRGAVLVVGLCAFATLGQAKCLPIEEPAGSAGLEDFKNLLVDGQFEDAFALTEFPDDSKQTLITSLAGELGAGVKTCVMLRRTRQSEHWINEAFLMESVSGVIVYGLVSGIVDGAQFRVISFKVTGLFSEIRELLF